MCGVMKKVLYRETSASAYIVGVHTARCSLHAAGAALTAGCRDQGGVSGESLALLTTVN